MWKHYQNYYNVGNVILQIVSSICLTLHKLIKKILKIPKGGNQNLLIKEQTTQCPKEKEEKNKQ